MNKVIWEAKCEARIKSATIKEKIYLRIALYADSIGKWSYLSMDKAKWKRISASIDKRDRP